MTYSQNCIDLITQFEPFHTRAFKPQGQLDFIIGYKHPCPPVDRRKSVSTVLALKYLESDLTVIATVLERELPALSQNQFDALCALVFDVSYYSFRNSVMFSMCRLLPGGCKALSCARYFFSFVYHRVEPDDHATLQKRRQRAVALANHFLGYEAFTIDSGGIICKS